MIFLKIIFFSALLVLFYTYIGYGIVLWLLIKMKHFRHQAAS
jgi:hypothetical protein